MKLQFGRQKATLPYLRRQVLDCLGPWGRLNRLGEVRGVGRGDQFRPALEPECSRNGFFLRVRSPISPFLRAEEKLMHVRRAGRGTWESVDPQRLQHQPQRALMLVDSDGAMSLLYLGAD